MVHLSVNVNKVATLRNSRGGSAAERARCGRRLPRRRRAGHHRAPARRSSATSRRTTCARLRRAARPRRPHVEFNIEGDPRPDLIDLVGGAGPTSARSCRSSPGEMTSQAGWRAGPHTTRGSGRSSAGCKSSGIRVSLFVDAGRPIAVRWAASIGADRVELYTEPFARAFEHGRDEAAEHLRAVYAAAASAGARARHSASTPGHDLDLDNLRAVSRACRSSTRCRSATPSCRGGVRRARSRSFASTSRSCSPGWPGWTDLLSRGLSYDPHEPHEIRRIAFGVAGVLFGLIAGWIIGTQQARSVRRRRGRRTARHSAAPAPRRRAVVLDETKVTALKSVAEREPSNAEPARRSSATCISTPNATTTRSSGTARRCKLAAERRQRQHGPRRLLLLHEPARQGARAVRPVAQDRSQARQDAAERRHRQRVRQAGSRRAREGVAAGASKLAPDSPEGQAAKRALDSLRSAHPPTDRQPSRCLMVRLLLLSDPADRSWRASSGGSWTASIEGCDRARAPVDRGRAGRRRPHGARSGLRHVRRARSRGHARRQAATRVFLLRRVPRQVPRGPDGTA